MGENFMYEYPQKGTPGQTNMWASFMFSPTFNHGPSPSEVDWGDPEGKPTKILKHTLS